MSVLFYLLESNLYLLIMYGFYRAILHRETFHQLNRIYLLAAVVISFTAPFFQVKYQRVSSPEMTYANIAKLTDTPIPIPATSNHKSLKQQVVSFPEYPSDRISHGVKILPTAYLLISLVFLFITLTGVFRIVALYRKSSRFSSDGVTHVLISRKNEVFSFLNWLFYHPELIRKEPAIIAHELVHIKQKHTIDLLFFDLIRAVSWFNPVLFFMRRDVKLNHEFLADEYASVASGSGYNYALLLINHAGSNAQSAIPHHMFNAKQLKSRILRLGQQRSQRKALIKYLILLPISAGIMGLSAFVIRKDYALISIPFANRSLIPVALKLSREDISPAATVRADSSIRRKADTITQITRISSRPVKTKKVVSSSIDIQPQDATLVALSQEDIRDSIRKYERAWGILSDTVRNEGNAASAILNIIQKERQARYWKALDSSRRSAANGGRYSFNDFHDVPDQFTLDRLANVETLIGRMNANYPELQRLISLSNHFKSQLSTGFPQYVGKTVIRRGGYLSLDGINIPLPMILYSDGWVKTDDERAAFFAGSD